MNRIGKVLYDKGISQAWLAEKLEKSNNTVSSWVRNAKQPTLDILIVISNLLNVEIIELIETSDSLKQKSIQPLESSRKNHSIYQGFLSDQNLKEAIDQFTTIVDHAQSRIRKAIIIVEELKKKKILVGQNGIFKVINPDLSSSFEIAIKFMILRSNSFLNGIWIQLGNKDLYLHLPATKTLILNEFVNEEVASKHSAKFEPKYSMPFSYEKNIEEGKKTEKRKKAFKRKVNAYASEEELLNAICEELRILSSF